MSKVLPTLHREYSDEKMHTELYFFTVMKSIANFRREGGTSLADFLKFWRENEDAFQENINSPRNRDLWVHTLTKVSDTLRSLKAVNINKTLLDNLDYLSTCIDWFENGMASLRADLHFRRANHVNRGYKKGDPDFKTEDYCAAIDLWEETRQTKTNRDYFTAKKMLCETDSEEIKWMNQLGEWRHKKKRDARCVTHAASRFFNLTLGKRTRQTTGEPPKP